MVEGDGCTAVGEGAAVVHGEGGVGCRLLVAGCGKREIRGQCKGLRDHVADLEASAVEDDGTGRKTARIVPRQHPPAVDLHPAVERERGVVPSDPGTRIEYQQFGNGQRGRGLQVQRILVEPHFLEGESAVAAEAEVVEQVEVNIVERQGSARLAEVVAKCKRAVLQVQGATLNGKSRAEGEGSACGREREARIERGCQAQHGEIGFLRRQCSRRRAAPRSIVVCPGGGTVVR